MSELHSLVRYLKRDGGIPSAKDFEDAGLYLTEHGGSVIGDGLWAKYRLTSVLHEEFKIVGMVLTDDGRKKGRFLVYQGSACIDEILIYTYKSTP